MLPNLFSGNFREIRAANELGHLRSRHPKVQRVRGQADTDSEGRFVEGVMVYPTKSGGDHGDARFGLASGDFSTLPGPHGDVASARDLNIPEYMVAGCNAVLVTASVPALRLGLIDGSRFSSTWARLF
jgi:hypothetical protein